MMRMVDDEGGGGKLRVQLVQHRVLLTLRDCEIKQDVSELRRAPHLELIKSAASVEASAPNILRGASGIGASTLTGIWCRDERL